MNNNTLLFRKILKTMETEFAYATNKDVVNKLYRHGRVFIRVYCLFGGACSKEQAFTFNNNLKMLRWKRLEELGYKTVLSTTKKP